MISTSHDTNVPTSVFVVSGSTGACGEQVVQTVLAQFPNRNVPVIRVSNVRTSEDVRQVVSRACNGNGIIVHTMVNREVRRKLLDEANFQGVQTIDLMGPLLDQLTYALEDQPAGDPGLYRRLNQDYFDRVSAIDFAMAQDDGKNPADWDKAEIVLVGVSRAGKSPLSLYLSVLGYMVANIPIVMELPIPKGIYELDRRRVFGLNIDPTQLVTLRKHRLKYLGVSSAGSAYIDPLKVFEETELALQVFKKGNFSIIDVTNKPIETSADEIILTLSQRFRTRYRTL